MPNLFRGLITDSRELKSYEKDVKWSSANGLSNLRLYGSLVVGAAMATRGIDASTATMAALLGALSDAEGSLIRLAEKYPRIQRFTRMYATEKGPKKDVVADKVFAASMLAGGLMGGYVPPIPALAVLGSETATVVTARHARKGMTEGQDLMVSRWGKLGMMCRFGAIGTFLASAATDGRPAEVLMAGGYASTVGAIGFAALGAMNIAQQGREARMANQAPQETVAN